jgi:toluene monooxygenase system ferredoxin subunit
MAKTLLCRVSDVPTDCIKELALDEARRVCVINAGGTFYACQAACPHEGFALCDGCVDGTTLTCLEHLWQWELSSGAPLGLAESPLTTFAVEVEGESVYLKD